MTTRTRARRAIAGVVVAGGVLIASASPALAHFCMRVDFNEMAASRAGKSAAWLTADEWREFLPYILAECGQPTVDAITAVLDSAGPGTLFMGPGLLAGGTIPKDGKTPRHFAYMLDAFETCQ